MKKKNESTVAHKKSRQRIAVEYATVIKPKLKDELNISNIMQVPSLKKIVLNVGVKEAVSDSKALQLVVDALTAISGQQPVKTLARKSIAGFKIRAGMKIGTRVTLRGDMMYAFFDKMVNVALPKVRDFQGVPTRFDGRGNYNLGIKEWSIFPELESIVGDRVHGLCISIETSAKSDEHAQALLKSLGMPFAKK